MSEKLPLAILRAVLRAVWTLLLSFFSLWVMNQCRWNSWWGQYSNSGETWAFGVVLGYRFWVYDGDERTWRALQNQHIHGLTFDGLELKFSLLCVPEINGTWKTFPWAKELQRNSFQGYWQRHCHHIAKEYGIEAIRSLSPLEASGGPTCGGKRIKIEDTVASQSNGHR